MFEPTTLPTAMPGEPFSAAVTLATSSGLEVPKPTRVSPISSGETPKPAGDADRAADQQLCARDQQNQSAEEFEVDQGSHLRMGRPPNAPGRSEVAGPCRGG